jgi:hypothetical protein
MSKLSFSYALYHPLYMQSIRYVSPQAKSPAYYIFKAGRPGLTSWG